MYSYIASYILGNSNYKIQNINNIYNFIICMLDNKKNEERQEILKLIKINIGMNFYNDFKIYYYNKLNISLD